MNALIATQEQLPIELERDEYFIALATWLEGKNPNTQRSYMRAIGDFLAFSGKHPRDIRPVDVAAWKENLKALGRSDSTIAQRLSAISSYYVYLQRPNGNGQLLMAYNPVDGVDRDDLDVSPYAHARKISVEGFRAIMGEIDTSTANGARDAAMLLFYVLCGRRRSEVISLYGRDTRQDGNKVAYRTRTKGGKLKWREMPPPVWDSIQHYLTTSGRELADDGPIFVAMVDNAQYLNEWRGTEQPKEEQPISGDAISQALKRYARRAGLNPEAISIHSIRHLAAELFKKASGGDIVATQQFLGHAHLNTTQIYLEQLEGEEHKHWQGMMNELAKEKVAA